MTANGKQLHVLGLSGGKDSAALAIYMRDKHPEIDMTYYFTDTGKELPEVIEFVNRLEGYIGKKIIDPYEEISRSNREKKDFDYWLKQHNNFLPSPQSRWCTIQMKLVPFEKWVQSYLDDGYEVITYVGIRSDEPYREGYQVTANKKIKVRMPFREDSIDLQGVKEILQQADLFSDTEEAKSNPNSAQAKGLPGYYEWRSRSGCTFCFYQRKIEWVRLKERYPEAFEEAKRYEKTAEDGRDDGVFYWLGKDTPLSSLEAPERVEQIKKEHQRKKERFLKRKRINVLQVNTLDIDRDHMDEIYDQQEGGGACITCYK
ncbi:phosphoadenosine phosphosulfate reductase family protein [Paraferrimonas sedimenticola]|uniref:Phosphoadenosine phosphosulfate reductase n=1 Tax=Paraferrimonas sedimenticola TaxID=375674 RepID=A0AA37RY21_9GAMM|nr:phosphoadenosine phosphosulfate reductase family protein [Paraferrimonas sedimenticola]GLP97004.1 phosphoadenosine phosphosulfate reductase [Paraferrimonas sedimenticola]